MIDYKFDRSAECKNTFSLTGTLKYGIIIID